MNMKVLSFVWLWPKSRLFGSCGLNWTYDVQEWTEVILTSQNQEIFLFRVLSIFRFDQTENTETYRKTMIKDF